MRERECVTLNQKPLDVENDYKSAVIIQKYWKRFYCFNSFLRIKLAVLKIQHAYKGWRLRIDFIRMRRSAIVIQSHLRGVFAREVRL